jgi:hypothetical protein
VGLGERRSSGARHGFLRLSPGCGGERNKCTRVIVRKIMDVCRFTLD